MIMNGIYTDEIRADLAAPRPAAGDQRVGVTVLRVKLILTIFSHALHVN